MLTLDDREESQQREGKRVTARDHRLEKICTPVGEAPRDGALTRVLLQIPPWDAEKPTSRAHAQQQRDPNTCETRQNEHGPRVLPTKETADALGDHHRPTERLGRRPSCLAGLPSLLCPQKKHPLPHTPVATFGRIGTCAILPSRKK